MHDKGFMDEGSTVIKLDPYGEFVFSQTESNTGTKYSNIPQIGSSHIHRLESLYICDTR